MRVVRATRFGDPEVLEPGAAPDPVAGPGEVVVDVTAADTLHLDTLVRRGTFPFPGAEPPYVPGGGVAGAVTAVGEGADGRLLGERVVARTGAGTPGVAGETVAARARRDSHTGGYAQRAAVRADAVVAVPAGVDLADAAALVNDGMTAALLMQAVGIRRGERVLVTPAGGGVGNLLVQLAHAAGARVVGAARGGRKLGCARRGGADAVVDYGRDGWQELVLELTGGHGADVVLDGVGGTIGRSCLHLTARGGRFAGYGAPSGEFTRVDPGDADRRGVVALAVLDLRLPEGGERRLIQRALAAVAAGRARPLVGQRFPLHRAAAAHTVIETRTAVGKTLLLP